MNEQSSTSRVALKWGLILAIASITYSAILFVTDNVGNRWLGFLAAIVSIIGITLAMREFKKLNGGYMAYGQGISVGTLTAAISGLLSSLFSVFYMTIIDTGIMERSAEKAREEMESKGNISDEDIDRAMEIMAKFQTPGIMFAFSVIVSILLGLIFSLVISAIIRKNKDNPFE